MTETTNPAGAANKPRVDNLHLSLGDNAILKGVSFQLKPGQVVSLLGPSGSGKTTLLRAVAGLEQPSAARSGSRTVRFFDAATQVDLPAEQRTLGLVFQSYALWPHRTVVDNVAYGLKLRRVSSAEIRARVESALGNLGLGHLAARHPHQLSGGQQQRVAIARALVYNPPVILLDEPLSNLDAKLREEARAWLRELIVSCGCPHWSSRTTRPKRWQCPTGSCCATGVIERRARPRNCTARRGRCSSPSSWAATTGSRASRRTARRRAMLAGDGWQL